MTTTTILRVKRRLDESPAEALVIHSKKAKLEGEPQSPSVFVFSGTVDDKDNLPNLKDALSKKSTKHCDNFKFKDLDLLRDKFKQSNYNQEHRMKVIDYKRGLFNEENKGDDPSRDFALVDLLKSNHTEDDVTKYAYDLYFCQSDNLSIVDVDDLEGIHSLHGDLFSTHRDIGIKDCSDESDDDNDEDSNDENNWRNEYPDTDNSIDEDDMIRIVRNLDLGDDLSSDENEEELVYSSSNGINQDDVEKFGIAYAKYKNKVLNDETTSGLPKLIEYDDSIVEEHCSKEENGDNGFFYPKNDDDDDDDLPSLIGSEENSRRSNSECSDFG